MQTALLIRFSRVFPFGFLSTVSQVVRQHLPFVAVFFKIDLSFSRSRWPDCRRYPGSPSCNSSSRKRLYPRITCAMYTMSFCGR